MENLPNELLVDIIKLMVNIDAMVCFRSSQLWKYVSFFVKLQTFVDLDYTGGGIRKNTIALVTGDEHLSMTILSNILFLKCHLPSSNFEMTSKKLKYYIMNSGHSINYRIIKESFPNLRYLETPYIDVFSLPDKITKANINCLVYSKLPESLISLTIRHNNYLNTSIIQDIASLPNLKRLTLDKMSETIKLSSASITHLILCDNFTARVEKWPTNLIYLHIGRHFFNQDKNKKPIFPLSLLYLKLHKEIQYVLPINCLNNVQYLSIGYPVHLNVQYLSIGNPVHLPVNLRNMICQSLTDCISKTNLISLRIIGNQTHVLVFPKTLKRLYITRCQMCIFKSLLHNISRLRLTHLQIKISSYDENNILSKWFNTMDNNILLSLKYLSININIGNFNINKIPSNVEYLNFNNILSSITCLAKTKITHLKINRTNNLPPTITHLKISSLDHNQIIFPDTIKKLHIWINDESLEHRLPRFLTHLRLFVLGDIKKMSFKLPKSLVFLAVPHNSVEDIPKTIRTVVLTSS